MISLRTAQYSTSELSTERHASCQGITCKIYFVFCLRAIKLNTVGGFFFFDTRAAEKESEWIGASKGLPERAPFPPGHILHYPESDSHGGLCTHAHIHTHTHTQALKTEIISRRLDAASEFSTWCDYDIVSSVNKYRRVCCTCHWGFCKEAWANRHRC